MTNEARDEACKLQQTLTKRTRYIHKLPAPMLPHLFALQT